MRGDWFDAASSIISFTRLAVSVCLCEVHVLTQSVSTTSATPLALVATAIESNQNAQCKRSHSQPQLAVLLQSSRAVAY